uniref:BPTI/Kunitz inhibitor domain-containing protein n=1 Tax=Cynoglossus semilaevis TaxID=244447 RepID=A0A3P8VAF0_CYNSE
MLLFFQGDPGEPGLPGDKGEKGEKVETVNIDCIYSSGYSPLSSSDRCLEPMTEGSCSDYVLLWYFHPRSRECRPFVYSGCGGNRNRFSTRQECQIWCGKERKG